MAKNKRIYYAVHQVGIKENLGGAFTAVHGVQSVGITTNFNLTQVFELGQLAIYENIEDLPDVEVSLSKVLDGHPLIYHLATTGATLPTLAGRSNAKCSVGMAIFDDTLESASGTPGSVLECSGMFISSVSYNFPLEDNFSEDVTIVGNNKVWANDPLATRTLPSPTFAGAFTDNADIPFAGGGVNRRQDLIMGTGDATAGVYGYDVSVFPLEIPGITENIAGTGFNIDGGTSDGFAAHLASITVSTDLGRENINELGRKGPYHRSVTFPIEVTTEYEVTAHSGDLVSATEEGIYTPDGSGPCNDSGNLKDRALRVGTCEGTRIFLGTKNKLSSVNYTGGDAGGGNVSVTYTFTTFNDFTVIHANDTNDSGSAWWTNRERHLTA
jgi:hypothetical protein